MIKFKKLDSGATIPKRQTSGSAGFDLYALADGIIKPSMMGCIETGISLEMPANTWGHILPRSSLAFTHQLETMAGVIDEDYRKDIRVLLINHGSEEFRYKAGDRVAQLVVSPYIGSAIEVDYYLSETDRKGGFGSTGRNDDERMDVIGQNGNTGEHYPECKNKAD